MNQTIFLRRTVWVLTSFVVLYLSTSLYFFLMSGATFRFYIWTMLEELLWVLIWKTLTNSASINLFDFFQFFLLALFQLITIIVVNEMKTKMMQNESSGLWVYISFNLANILAFYCLIYFMKQRIVRLEKQRRRIIIPVAP